MLCWSRRLNSVVITQAEDSNTGRHVCSSKAALEDCSCRLDKGRTDTGLLPAEPDADLHGINNKGQFYFASCLSDDRGDIKPSVWIGLDYCS